MQHGRGIANGGSWREIALALALSMGLPAPGALAQTITNTAVATYNDPDGTPFSAGSNTVSRPVLRFLAADKAFSPDAIASGGTSTLTITVVNANAFEVTDLAFEDAFPAAPGPMVVGAPLVVANSCGGTLTDASGQPLQPGDGGIRLAGGTIAAGASCSVAITVTAAASGTYTNTLAAGDIDTAQGVMNGTAATGTLVVGVASPTIGKSFTPAAIRQDQTSTLTLEIANPGGAALTGVSVTDVFPTAPAALVVADPPNASTTCGGTLADAGGGALGPGDGGVRLAGATIPGGGSCTVSIDVSAPIEGSYTNTVPVNAVATDQGVGNAGPASATLTVAPPTATAPATVTFYQYVPGNGTLSLQADGGGYGGDLEDQRAGTNDRNGTTFSALPQPMSVYGQPLDLTQPLPVRETTVYHAGEPVILTLSDPNRNADPAVREFINVTLTNPVTGDREILRLRETGPDTGVFAAVIQGVGPRTPVAANDGRISVGAGSTLRVEYTDSTDATDTVRDTALVDPFGVLFDAVSGQPVNGGTITIIDTATGQPAAVFGDDGISRYPSTLTFGAGAIDSSGASYNFPDGGYRFPFVQPGSYIYVITPPGAYRVPSSACTLANPAACPDDPNGDPYSVVEGSFGDAFVVMPGPALNIDIPADPPADPLQDLLLRKTVSQAEAAAGDHLQYALRLENRGAAIGTTVTVTDTLPAGLRYRAGSLRIAGVVAPDPAIGADGLTLTIPVGPLGAAPASVEIRYVVQVVGGAAQAAAVNRARADDDGAAGGRHSNVAQVAVRIRPPLFGDAFTIVGRVLDSCAPSAAGASGVAKVRLLLEDGTYVTTDRDGMFHFEGVRPGTHVVQLDLDSLAPGMRVVPRIQNSRFAGRAYSQFVDVRGGGLWRTDFHVCSAGGDVGLTLSTRRGVPAAALDRVREFTVRAQFDSGRDTLKPRGESDLNRLAEQLRSADIERIAVIGHTDSQPLRGRAAQRFGDNHGLSRARAQVVGAHLARRLGLSAEQVGIEGRGPDDPVAPNDTAAARAKNRRTEVVVYQREKGGQVIDPDALRHRIDVDGGPVAVRNMRVSVMLPDGASYVPGSAQIDDSPVADPQVENGVATFRLGDAGPGRPWRHAIVFVTRLRDAPSPAAACADAGSVRALVTFDTEQANDLRTPAAGNAIPCPERVAPQAAADAAPQVRSERKALAVHGASIREAPAEIVSRSAPRKAIRSDVDAAGGDRDWLAAATPGIDWLYPVPGQSPRAPATRIVIKHLPTQTVVLRSADGAEVHPLTFEGVRTSGDNATSVSIWRGVPLREGENRFEALVLQPDGAVVERLQRSVHYANGPARAELVPAESVLVADGIHPPVIAVRLLDRAGQPVRAGVTGGFRINAPFMPRETQEQMQMRQLAGRDRFDPTWRIEGDNGIAYIELQPTTESGEAVLSFSFPNPVTQGTLRDQEIRAWLAAAPRDWLVVGFAEGTVGYTTLSDNASALPDGTGDELHTDGQTRLYAKGRVLGKWLLTLAYDSDKAGEPERRRSLLSTIDPNEYYTLYGDGAEQRYDAPSQQKLYLKLERGQFYGLFGDYDTGLTVTQLSRYSRTLNGVKSELGGGALVYNAFAAQTPQNHARDEIRGDGTSGLYRLSRRQIVLNSEKIRIETRDRYRSERIAATRHLARHLDYDIDYANGTLFFREPVPSRDADFNAVFIVAEYETFGAAEEELSTGGRVGVNLLEGRLSAGVTGIREEQVLGDTGLAGVDVKLRVGNDTELRLESARTEGRLAAVPREGNAWLAEVEHHAGNVDALLYSRRQDPGFGLQQQNGSESGTDKVGADLGYNFTPEVALRGQAYRQEYLPTAATREVGNARLQYRDDLNTFSAGYQLALDQAAGGQEFESQHATFGASRLFWDRALELSAAGDVGLGGSAASTDFPSRYQLGAGYALTSSARLTATQEFTDGDAIDTSTTRIGLLATPWKGARLNTTLNQAAIGEYGPRNFAQMGLTQALLIDERWGADVHLDGSRTFNESGTPAFVPNANQPAPVGGGTLTDDFVAVSGGLTYRSDLWSWNGRAESRNGSSSERYGLTMGWLRQAVAGVAVSASLQAFQTDLEAGAAGRYASASLAGAWRPLGSRWSVLDRLVFKYDELERGSGVAPAGGELFGHTTLSLAGDATSRRWVNNLSINRVSREWTEHDRQGNLFRLEQRNQWSLYYGAKYAADEFDGERYTGYTDLLAAEWRHDLTRRWDLGLQVASLNAWQSHTHEYSAGPQIGWSPVDNGWLSVGYNIIGFYDRDFEAARYTAEGPYLKLRFKFDQNTRVGADRPDPRAQDWDSYAAEGRIAP